MPNKVNDSPLVRSVLALDNHLSELERIGAKINATDLSGDFDLDHLQKLLSRFAECGRGISEEVTSLSAHLQDAQTRAEGVARGVSQQAELFNTRRHEHEQKVEQFRLLGEKVRELNMTIAKFRSPDRGRLNDEERAKLKAELPAFEDQLKSVVDELQNLRQSAREAGMKNLAKSAESLVQTLQTAQKRLHDIS
jgi:chromosome segregation ATPase